MAARVAMILAAGCLFAFSITALAEPAADSQLIRLTDDGYFKQRPAWSPDGKSVVFARHRGATIFLFQLDLKSGKEQRLTKSANPEYDAVFSPDGKDVLLAYDKASPNQGDIEVHRFELESR